jgi:hypothetical protein
LVILYVVPISVPASKGYVEMENSSNQTPSTAGLTSKMPENQSGLGAIIEMVDNKGKSGVNVMSSKVCGGSALLN